MRSLQALAPTVPIRRAPHLLRIALGLVLSVVLIATSCGGDVTASSESASATPPPTRGGQVDRDEFVDEDSTAEEDTIREEDSGSAGSSALDEDSAVVTSDEEGTTAVDNGALAERLADAPTQTISDADRDGLVFMREEEKLALDVYQALFESWGLRIFDNIAGAEQTHTDTVKTLLDRYDIADPALDQPAGVFQNPEIQGLHDELVARGNQSLVEALQVGALIEDLDIADLQARASDEPAIDLVYTNLEKGSRNHLRAFVRQLDARGEEYQPSHISADEYEAIINSRHERGMHQ